MNPSSETESPVRTFPIPLLLLSTICARVAVRKTAGVGEKARLP
jgi:hypothetical protein